MTRRALKVVFGIVCGAAFVAILLMMSACSYVPVERQNPDGTTTDTKQLKYTGTQRKLNTNEQYKKDLAELQEKVLEKGVNPQGMSKSELIDLLLEEEDE